mgnify:FL=1
MVNIGDKHLKVNANGSFAGSQLAGYFPSLDLSQLTKSNYISFQDALQIAANIDSNLFNFIYNSNNLYSKCNEQNKADFELRDANSTIYDLKSKIAEKDKEIENLKIENRNKDDDLNKLNRFDKYDIFNGESDGRIYGNGLLDNMNLQYDVVLDPKMKLTQRGIYICTGFCVFLFIVLVVIVCISNRREIPILNVLSNTKTKKLVDSVYY